jgi:Ser/Thr protein kinase RdoA (MazF antagonist)
MPTTPRAVAARFRLAGPPLAVQAYGGGNINDTYRVTVQGGAPVVLQRINPQVFAHPRRIMRNIRTYIDHVAERGGPEDGRRWVVPYIVPARDGADYVIDAEGGFWRAMQWVTGATTYPRIQNLAHAREVGYALGRFHRLLSDLDPARLYDTLEGYHITPRYLRHYDAVVGRMPPGDVEPEVAYGKATVARRRDLARVLEDARARGALQPRPIHGDPKVDNILIDDPTGQAVSIIDLDTLKPGLVHYDIGDCLRSGCNPLGEETQDLAAVRFETDLCRAILAGYLAVAGGFFTESDYDYVYAAVRLLAFEQGLRFFTDYLEGDVYYKVTHPTHNLERALVQFRLLESIEAQAEEIRAIVADLR